MALLEKEEQRLRNTIRFVTATQELIDEEGLENVSIRKIAARSGFHNSTIYLYFQDVDELIALASLKHFTAYSQALSELSRADGTPKDTFLAVWTCFGQTVFAQPQIFYNFFFGKYSENLTPLFHRYYDLFPEEREQYTDEIEDMYYGKSLRERCLKLLTPLIGTPGVRVTADNAELINEIVICCLKELLTRKCTNPDMDTDQLTRSLMDMLRCVAGI